MVSENVFRDHRFYNFMEENYCLQNTVCILRNFTLTRKNFRENSMQGNLVLTQWISLFFFAKKWWQYISIISTLCKKILENCVARISFELIIRHSIWRNFFTVYLKCVNDVDLTKFLLNHCELLRVIKFFHNIWWWW